jgi:hypothetical protein
MGPARLSKRNPIVIILLLAWSSLYALVVIPVTLFVEVLPGEQIGPVDTGDMWPVAIGGLILELCLLWFAFKSRK